MREVSTGLSRFGRLSVAEIERVRAVIASKDHVLSIKAEGTGKHRKVRAFCSCHWVASIAWGTEAVAEADHAEHVLEVANVEGGK